ncbi:hypothetical protein Acor_60240 [Acrocarpospora corrugata]|uniref:Uncharacterized protein n=1 Tax=Acrocarpospora corrugata TaxID=35763 RepID=A0A5M3WC00_9ACTN|nr:hypothetical protein [Acrocarpospora corrugata]GES03958.1 hypothetical protein Acor_60240 [Acrocarpospora corrugata]
MSGELADHHGSCPYCSTRQLAGKAIPIEALPRGEVLPPEDILGVGVAITGSQREETGPRAEARQRKAFEDALERLQDEAMEVAKRHDNGLFHEARCAVEKTTEAGAALQQRATIRDAVHNYRASVRLAAKRAQESDDQHTNKPLRRRWVIVVAGATAIVDVALYWELIFNLGPLDSLASLVQWGAAACLALLWTVAMDFSLEAYRTRERSSRDARSALRDHNRDHRDTGLDVAARSRAEAILAQIKAADRLTRLAFGFVLTVTLINTLLIGGRVASMVRSAGRSVAEAAIFGLAAGLIVCAVFAVLTILLTRGNDLGNRLRDGRAGLAKLGARLEASVQRATTLAGQATRHVDAADLAAVHAEEDRQWVLRRYRQGMTWAMVQLGLDEMPIRPENIVVHAMTTYTEGSKTLETARLGLPSLAAELRQAREEAQELQAALHGVTEPTATTQAFGMEAIESARPVPPPSRPVVSRVVPPLRPGEGSRIIPLDPPLPRPGSVPGMPNQAKWLPIAGAVVAAAAALVMAVTTASPTERSKVVQTDT